MSLTASGEGPYGHRMRFSGARSEVIDACGHIQPPERPVEFADAVLRFV